MSDDENIFIPGERPLSEIKKEEEKPIVSSLGATISIPKLSLEDYEIPVEEEDRVSNTVDGAIQYAFIGTGQGGGKLASEFYKIGYKKTICVNTSDQDLSCVDIPEKQKLLYDIGAGGAGKDMSKGESAALKYSQETYDLMKRVFGEKVDHIMIVVSSGGGSGAGSIPPLIMVAKKYLRYIGHVNDLDKRVGIIVTLPTNGESQSFRVARNSHDLVENLSTLAENSQITPLIVVDNDRIKNLYKGLPVAKFWTTVNQSIAGLFDIFNRLAVQHSPYTSFDPTDYQSVIASGGHCIMGVTSVKDIGNDGFIDETKISSAIKNNLEKTLLASGFKLGTAQSAASIVVGGKDMFENVGGLQEAIEYGFDTLASITDGAAIHRGVYQDSSSTLKVFTIIGGLDKPDSRYEILRTFAKEKYLDA